MIPKYIFDTKQQTLNNISLKDKLLNYRKFLYFELVNNLKSKNIIKEHLINEYKIKVSEIDYELQSLIKKEINKNKNTQI